MNRHLFCRLSIVGLLGLLGSLALLSVARAESAAMPEDEKIFAPLRQTGKSMKPEQIGELLVDLLGAYRQQKDYLAEWDDLLSKYIELSNVSMQKCNFGNTFDWSALMEFPIEQWYPLLRVYANHYARAQFQLCEPKLYARLYKDVERLSSKENKFSSLILEGVVKAYNAATNQKLRPYDRKTLASLKDLPLDTLNWGVVNYIRRELGPFGKWKKLDEREYAIKFRSTIMELCLPIVNSLEDDIPTYQPFVEHNLAVNDQFAREWLAKYRICKQIQLEREEVQQTTFKYYVHMQ